ncbi:MAG: DUF2993 domain-containing protein [Protaetiibacter sp.]
MSDAPSAPVELPRRRRRRVWPWVLLGSVVVLAGAAVAADVLVRGYAERAIAEQVATELEVPDGTPVDVRIGGFSILLQALTGSLERVDVGVDTLALGPLTGDLDIVATGVPLDENVPTRALTVRYAIPASALTALAPELSGVTVDEVTLEGSEVVARGTVTVFGVSLDLGLGLTPSAVDGDLAFDATSIRIGEQTLTVEELRGNLLLGGLADMLLQQRTVCIADALPAALTLTDVRVDGTELVATLDGSGAVLGSLGDKGVCG